MSDARPIARSEHLAKSRTPKQQATERHGLSLKKSHPLLLILVVAVLSSCGRPTGVGEETPGRAAPGSDVVDRSLVQNGPVSFSAVVEPASLSLSDTAQLALTIDYADGVDVQFPPFGKTVGGFAIRDIRRPLPKTDAGQHVIQEILTLEPLSTGRMTIYPINVTYTDNRGNGDGKQHRLCSEQLNVNVTSVVAADEASLDKLRPAAQPLAIDYPPRYGLWAGILITVIAAAVIGYAWRRRRAARQAVERVPTPGELAFEALQRLRRSHLAERDAKLYYVELTGIVRVYIERTKGIRAPEQTTEEFLREIAQREAFPREEGVRLRNFLQAADLVKFAAHQPRSEDIEESFRRAEEFVGYANDEMTGQK